VKTLGRERLVSAWTRAAIDLGANEVHVAYPEGTTQADPFFQPGEGAFVCNMSLEEGGIRLSLWGLKRGELVSRRSSLDDLSHGELAIGLRSESPDEALAQFESKWADEGVRFLFPMMDSVLERSLDTDASTIVVELARALVDLDEDPAARDTADMLAAHHRLDPTNGEIAVLAALAEARWVKRRTEASRGGVLSRESRSELTDALTAGREWLGKARELDAEGEDFDKAETELAQAEKLLDSMP
jgi:hypothetical protein